MEHHKREVGSSNYTFRKLLRLWLAYWNYSVIPLRISSVLGGISACAGFAAVLITVIRKVFFDPAMPLGWPSLICTMLIFFGLILLVLGIIGEYLGKMLLTLNNTPQYIIRETLNTTDTDKDTGGKERKFQ